MRSKIGVKQPANKDINSKSASQDGVHGNNEPIRDTKSIPSKVLDNDLGSQLKQKRAIHTSEASSPNRAKVHLLPTQYSDSDEVMVKIDPCDPFLDWDADEPPPGPAGKQKRWKKFGPPTMSKDMRGNSIDRDFIVPDNVVYMASDCSSDESPNQGKRNHSYSSNGTIDNEDDGRDLHIDMRPKYAFNADLLRK